MIVTPHATMRAVEASASTAALVAQHLGCDVSKADAMLRALEERGMVANGPAGWAVTDAGREARGARV